MCNTIFTHYSLKDSNCLVLLQELLYLYGFVIDNNPDDYVMVFKFIRIDFYHLFVCLNMLGHFSKVLNISVIHTDPLSCGSNS